MPCAKWRMATTTTATTTAMSRHQARSVIRTLSYGGSDGSARFVWCSPFQPATPVKTSAPVPAATNPGKERAPDLLRGDLPAGGRHLEQEKCGDQRPPEERGYRREGTREDEELSSRSLQSNQPDRERTETEPERDQRGFGAENESESQSRERGGEDAGECDRGDRVCSETFQRRVSAVARKPNGGGNQQPCESGYEDDVPPGGLAPAEFVGDHVPHEVDQVVDRGLEEHGRERDGHAEQRREHERSDVCLRLRVAHVADPTATAGTHARPSTLPARSRSWRCRSRSGCPRAGSY